MAGGDGVYTLTLFCISAYSFNNSDLVCPPSFPTSRPKDGVRWQGSCQPSSGGSRDGRGNKTRRGALGPKTQIHMQGFGFWVGEFLGF